MNSQSASDIGARKVRVFSAVWSEELGAAIAAAAPSHGYTMSLVGEDGRAVIAAVNQGIDAHLEACFVPDRGDRYGGLAAQSVTRKLPGNRLECVVSPESLVTLVRRLMQADDPVAESLAASICQTLDLELVQCPHSEVRHDEVRHLPVVATRQAVEDLPLDSFVGTIFSDVRRAAAFELFELYYPEEYRVWEKRLCDSLTFDPDHFLASPEFMVEEVDLGEQVAVLVASH